MKLVVAIAVLIALALGVYIAGERTCPPAAWAFWRHGNFACIQSG